MSSAPTRHRRFKDAIYEQLARLGKAVAAPRRLELLDLLCQGPRTVEALAAQASCSIANTSQHLQVLRAARLVDADKRGLYVEYRLADDEVCRFFLALRGLAEARLAEVDQTTRAYFAERGTMEPIASPELLRRVNATLGPVHRLDYNKVVKGELARNILSQRCLLYTSPSPRDRTRSRMPSSA